MADTINFAGGVLTRVSYVDVPIPPEAAGLTAADIAAHPWCETDWAEGEQLRAGAAAWFADVDGARVVFDPVLAADDALRADLATSLMQQQLIAEAFANAGFDRESVDLVALSHIDGIGMVGWQAEDGSWTPFFPNARILLSEIELAELRTNLSDATNSGGDLALEAFAELLGKGHIDACADGAEIVPGVHAETSGGHGPGHAVFHFGERGAPDATLIGHLAVSPLHLATGVCEPMHVDAVLALENLMTLAEGERVLIGPLWPAPGCGRWTGTEFKSGAP